MHRFPHNSARNVGIGNIQRQIRRFTEVFLEKGSLIASPGVQGPERRAIPAVGTGE